MDSSQQTTALPSTQQLEDLFRQPSILISTTCALSPMAVFDEVVLIPSPPSWTGTLSILADGYSSNNDDMEDEEAAF